MSCLLPTTTQLSLNPIYIEKDMILKSGAYSEFLNYILKKKKSFEEPLFDLKIKKLSDDLISAFPQYFCHNYREKTFEMLLFIAKETSFNKGQKKSLFLCKNKDANSISFFNNFVSFVDYLKSHDSRYNMTKKLLCPMDIINVCSDPNDEGEFFIAKKSFFLNDIILNYKYEPVHIRKHLIQIAEKQGFIERMTYKTSVNHIFYVN